MTTLIAFIVAIAILVVFHELGHYVVARLCDVKVLKFSIGFGNALYTKRFSNSETEWVISAIPLGGYVKMLDENEGEVAAHELPRAFNRKPVWQRMAIVVAGPIANLLLAVVLYFMLFIHGVPGLKPVLGEIVPNSPAAVAGLQSKQTIVSINGQPTPSWQEIRWILLDLVLQQKAANVELLDVQGERSFRVLEMSSLKAADLDGDFMQKLGLQPFQPPIYPVIGKLVEGGVAQRAGLQVNDRVLLADGQKVPLWDDWVNAVRSHPGKPLDIEIERAGAVLKLSLTPEVIVEGGKTIGRIGAAAFIDKTAFEAMLTQVSYPPLAALQEALRKTWETAIVSLKMMGKMVEGEVSLKNLSGPITIADYAGQSAQLGAGAYISFLALISISLGVLNLLPIPLLDGGHLLYYSVELVKGSPVSESLWEAGQKVGIALLVTMMAFALYNDISRLILG
ncbi:RIP metalloprotease RseP [Sideroxydans lithotrophicus]|uniref:Zinc metalloprotease n=1 Tax=Sideroxydans lithotrophicus (strain ES-1) TaxID=580332 RepID=D5CSE1_SIDLE|nr:RIP metalloprotease RseP [Sideroxydans lithotrophicus]ADE11877.1 membrane-associated zinc metalloprotease [Sideroxydans lithotrophicus ES-1]